MGPNPPTSAQGLNHLPQGRPHEAAAKPSLPSPVETPPAAVVPELVGLKPEVPWLFHGLVYMVNMGDQPGKGHFQRQKTEVDFDGTDLGFE